MKAKYKIFEEDSHYAGLHENAGIEFLTEELDQAKEELLKMYAEHNSSDDMFRAYICVEKEDSENEDGPYQKIWSPTKKQIQSFSQNQKKKKTNVNITIPEVGIIRSCSRTHNLFNEVTKEVLAESRRTSAEGSVLYYAELFNEEENRIDFYVLRERFTDTVLKLLILITIRIMLISKCRVERFLHF